MQLKEYILITFRILLFEIDKIPQYQHFTFMLIIYTGRTSCAECRTLGFRNQKDEEMERGEKPLQNKEINERSDRDPEAVIVKSEFQIANTGISILWNIHRSHCTRTYSVQNNDGFRPHLSKISLEIDRCFCLTCTLT